MRVVFYDYNHTCLFILLFTVEVSGSIVILDKHRDTRYVSDKLEVQQCQVIVISIALV
jgi:hypothetical protein